MSISQDKKAVVIDRQGLEYICSCIKLLQSVPELLNDLTPSQKTVYSSYKTTELINALGENLQTYVNTSLGALTHLKKEIVQTVPSVDTAEENTIYLLKNDGDGGYSQYLLINGVVENLGSTTAVDNVYTKTEIDAKFALLNTLNDLIATVGGLNELKTNTKESIVKAINELNDRNYLEVIEITDKSVLDYAKTFDILTHNYFYANNCVDLPNNEHYGYCSVEVSQDPLYRDVTFYSPTDGRIYVNTIGANADGSDYGAWSGWHKHLTNDDIVDVIDENSTNNQIPSAKAIYDNYGLKTYTSLDQIGLNTGCTMTDILNTLTDYSQLIVNSSYLAVSDRPLNSPSDELVTITRLWHSRITIISTDGNGKMCTGSTSYSGKTVTFNGWKKVCTTSVPDVSFTPITFKDSNIVSLGNSGYCINNGWCHLVLEIQFNADMSFGWTGITNCKIPNPKTIQRTSKMILNSTTTPVKSLICAPQGELVLYGFASNTEQYFGSISYPVADDWRP